MGMMKRAIVYKRAWQRCSIAVRMLVTNFYFYDSSASTVCGRKLAGDEIQFVDGEGFVEEHLDIGV